MGLGNLLGLIWRNAIGMRMIGMRRMKEAFAGDVTI